MARSETIDALSFEDVLAKLSTAFVRATADQISSEIVRWLQNVGLALEVDRASIGQINPSDGILYATHAWARDGIAPLPHALNANQQVPWLAHKIFAGETVVLGSVEDVPPEAAKDLEYARQVGSKSTVAVPLRIGGAVVGAVVFGSIIRQRTWSPRTVQRLRLIAEVFGNALERERAVAEVRRLREEAHLTSRAMTMGQLTASLAHELNQPLGAISSNAQAARRFLAAKRPDLAELRAAVEEIIRDNSRAAETIRSVRALFERGQIEMSPLDLRRILLDVEHILRPEAISKHISLRLDLPSSLPAVVGNRTQLVEVLMNLALNAFDSICEDSAGPREIEMRARRSEMGHVQIAVRDSGKGIAPEIMPGSLMLSLRPSLRAWA